MIITKPTTDAYREGWLRVFGKRRMDEYASLPFSEPFNPGMCYFMKSSCDCDRLHVDANGSPVAHED